MADRQTTRNPIDRAFVAGSVPRHQIHANPRHDRRIKHKRPFWDGEE